MTYGMLLCPHANSRYQEAVRPLALGEMRLLLRSVGIEAQPVCESVMGADRLRFDCPALSEAQIQRICRHSAMYLLCQLDQGLLRPLCGPAAPYLGRDLSGILKYKGKTNEAFTRLLINYALCSGDFADAGETPLRLMDPMCGRGTALFEALNRGFNAYGADVSKADLDEGCRFLKKYLEYHRMKHRARERSLTLPGGKSAAQRTLELAPQRQAFDEGDTREAAFLCQDAALAARALPEKHFHLAVCDLPYGVQHGPSGKGGFDQLLSRTLPQLLRVLKPGGALALSFNTYTLPLAKVREHLDRAGFDVCQGGPYEGLAHWVEQAIVRDVAVGVRRSH